MLQVQASMSVLGQWGALGQKRLLVSVGECWESVDECWGVLASAGGWPWRACLHQHQEGGGGCFDPNPPLPSQCRDGRARRRRGAMQRVPECRFGNAVW